MSDANRVGFVYEASESDGTPITPAGDGVEIPFSGESLAHETTRVISEIIRNDRQVKARPRVGIAASGDVNFELLYAAFDQFFEAALQSVAWTGAVADVTGSDIEATASQEFISSTVSAFAGLAGLIVRVSGFANAANNGFFRVDTVTTTTLADDTINVSKGTPVAEGVGPAITVESSQYITNGTRQQVFTLQREYGDLATEFVKYNNMVVDTLALEIAPEAILSGSFGFQGQREESATATFVSGSLTSAPDNPVFSAVDNVPRIVEGVSDEIAADQVITALAINLNNNSRGITGIQRLGPVSQGSGRADITGTLSMFYLDKGLADKHLDDTESALFIVMEDENNQAYIIELPSVRYDASPRPAGGPDTDVSVEMTWGASMDATLGFTMRMHRLA